MTINQQINFANYCGDERHFHFRPRGFSIAGASVPVTRYPCDSDAFVDVFFTFTANTAKDNNVCHSRYAQRLTASRIVVRT